MKLRMAWLLLALALPAAGGPLRDWLQQGAASHDGLGADETLSQAALPPGVRKLADLAYGPDVR
ncbi:hypothetical protein, partial [Aquitalea magnusonii]